MSRMDSTKQLVPNVGVRGGHGPHENAFSRSSSEVSAVRGPGLARCYQIEVLEASLGEKARVKSQPCCLAGVSVLKPSASDNWGIRTQSAGCPLGGMAGDGAPPSSG